MRSLKKLLLECSSICEKSIATKTNRDVFCNEKCIGFKIRARGHYYRGKVTDTNNLLYCCTVVLVFLCGMNEQTAFPQLLTIPYKDAILSQMFPLFSAVHTLSHHSISPCTCCWSERL